MCAPLHCPRSTTTLARASPSSTRPARRTRSSRGTSPGRTSPTRPASRGERAAPRVAPFTRVDRERWQTHTPPPGPQEGATHRAPPRQVQQLPSPHGASRRSAAAPPASTLAATHVAPPSLTSAPAESAGEAHPALDRRRAAQPVRGRRPLVQRHVRALSVKALVPFAIFCGVLALHGLS